MLHPMARWAQRKDRVFIEVQLRDIKNESIELSQTNLTFQGQSGKDKYKFSFELFAAVDKSASKWTKTGFSLLFVLEKQDKDGSFWPRLLKGKEKNQYIQVDWSKWVDQDEEKDEGDKGLGGLDPSMMQNFANMGGMPGMGGMGGMPGMGGMGGFPGMGGMGGMPGMGGFPGMGGMQGPDMQDDMPDLQKEEEQKPQEKAG